MTDQEIKEVTKPLQSIYREIDYGEAVVIGSVVGQLIAEIERLRERKQLNKIQN